MLRTLKLKDNNENLLELLYFVNSPRQNKNQIKAYSEGYTHISITVKDLKKLYKKLKKSKVKFNSEPRISEDKKGTNDLLQNTRGLIPRVSSGT